jgi:uncharacterized protein (TIGR02453 family)
LDRYGAQKCRCYATKREEKESLMMYPAAGVQFLTALANNNNREWFQTNKTTYETHVKEPARKLAETIQIRLSAEIGSEIDFKIFRINRDIRFSKDKTPYNTHVRFGFWEADEKIEKPMAGPAFYLSIEADRLHVGAGCMQFPPNSLEAYRHHIGLNGEDVADTIEALEAKNARFDPPALKRVPRGFDTEHPQAELMKRKGLTCWFDNMFGAARDITADEITDAFTQTLPIYNIVKKL